MKNIARGSASNKMTTTATAVALAALLIALAAGIVLDNKDRKPTTPSAAASAPVKASPVEAEVSAVAALLRKKHPDVATEGAAMNISRVALGKDVLYEVVSDQVVFYTNRTVDYVLFGDLFIGEGKETINFTRRPANPSQAQAPAAGPSGTQVFNSLPHAAGMQYTYGAGTHRIAVFEDPDCPACQQLHADLDTFGAEIGLQVTVFPFILKNKHPNATARARALVCTKDPAASWKAWMLAAKGQSDLDALWAKWAPINAPVSDCPRAASVDAWQVAGKDLGMEATPTIMYANGDVSEGVLTREMLREAVDYVAADLSGQK